MKHSSDKTNACECGCGALVKKGRRFITHHNCKLIGFHKGNKLALGVIAVMPRATSIEIDGLNTLSLRGLDG